MPNRNQHALDFLHENDNSVRRKHEHQASASPHEVSTRAHEVDVSLSHLNHNTSGLRKVLSLLVVVGLSSPVLIGLLSQSSKNTSEPNAVAPVTSNMLPEAPDPSIPAPATPASVDTSTLTTAIDSAKTQNEVHVAIAELVRKRTDIIGSDRSALFQLAAETQGELGVQAADLRVTQITSSIADLRSSTRIAELTADVSQVNSAIQALQPGVGNDAFISPEQKQELERLFNARRVYLAEEKKKLVRNKLSTVVTETSLKIIEGEMLALERLFSKSLFDPADFQGEIRAAKVRIIDAKAMYHGTVDEERADNLNNQLKAFIENVTMNTKDWEQTLNKFKRDVQIYAAANLFFERLYKADLVKLIDKKITDIRGGMAVAERAAAQRAAANLAANERAAAAERKLAADAEAKRQEDIAFETAKSQIPEERQNFILNLLHLKQNNLRVISPEEITAAFEGLDADNIAVKTYRNSFNR
jgi:hypothetical protein